MTENIHPSTQIYWAKGDAMIRHGGPVALGTAVEAAARRVQLGLWCVRGALGAPVVNGCSRWWML